MQPSPGLDSTVASLLVSSLPAVLMGILLLGLRSCDLFNFDGQWLIMTDFGQSKMTRIQNKAKSYFHTVDVDIYREVMSGSLRVFLLMFLGMDQTSLCTRWLSGFRVPNMSGPDCETQTECWSLNRSASQFFIQMTEFRDRGNKPLMLNWL